MLSPDRIVRPAPLPPPPPITTSCAAPSPTSAATGARSRRSKQIAEAAGVTPTELHHLFRRWAGLTPKAFLQALTLDSARQLLRDSASVLDASYEVGLSGPRPAARSVRHPRGDVARRMEVRRRRPDHLLRLSSLAVRQRAGDGDRARACGLAFADPGEERAALADMRGRWPQRELRRGQRPHRAARARASSTRSCGAPDRPLRVVLIGTDFEVRVWERCCASRWAAPRPIPTSPARSAAPKAARAVGAAVGKNPVSFVVPCHRVVGKSGDLTGYHWGLTRKRAMLGWEAGKVAA